MPDTCALPLSGNDPTRDLRRCCYAILIAIATAVQVVHVMNTTRLYNPAIKNWPPRNPPHTPLLSANDRSRWCTVWSLVERGTFQIDEINKVAAFRTIDLVMHNGHLYSSKPPLLPVVAAGIYWVQKHALGWDLIRQPHNVVHTTLLLLNVLPFAISLMVLARMAERYGKTDAGRIGLVAISASATFLTTFINTFNNHTIAANCVLWSLAACLRALDSRDSSPLSYILAGFWSGLAVAMELPAAAFCAGAGLLLLLRNPRWTVLYFVPAVLLPLGAHLGLNWIQTGSLRPFYASFGTDLYVFTYNGRPSYWSNPQGIDRNLDSPPYYLLHCLLGHHGIFSLSPIFLACLWSWMRPGKAEDGLRPWIWLGWICTVVVVGFYLTRTNNYNYGGVTSGLRWTFWLIPLWLIALLPALDSLVQIECCRRRRLWGGLFLLAVAISVFSAMMPWNNPWTHPWLFQALEQAGWINYR